MKKDLIRRKSRSFTLIEVAISAGIILIFIGALITVFNVGSKNIVVSEHQLQAANYNRDKLELYRQVRDTGWMVGTAWPMGMANGSTTDYPPAGPVTFKRTVTLAMTNDAVKITVTTSWDDFGQTHQQQAIGYLTNWKK